MRQLNCTANGVVCDINQDGHLDIVSGFGYLYFGDGNGGFERQSDPITSGGDFAAVANFDQDPVGILDVVTVTKSGDFHFAIGYGGGRFYPEFTYTLRSDYVTGLSVADFDGDSFLDILVSHGNLDELSFLRWRGTGFLPAYPIYVGDTVSGVIYLATGDFDNDDSVDFVISAGNSHVYQGNGDGTFQYVPNSSFSQFFSQPLVADVTGDGNLDIVSAAFANQSYGFYLFRGNGESKFFNRVHYPANRRILAMTLADCNNDGFSDVVASSVLSGSRLKDAYVSLYLGDGDGFVPLPREHFSGRDDRESSPSWQYVLCSDFDEDGAVDVVTSTQGIGAILLVNKSFELDGSRMGLVNAVDTAIYDVLFVNGLSGYSAERRVNLAVGQLFTIEMRLPPSVQFPDQAPFALYVWKGVPDETTFRRLPYGLGSSAMPMPLTGEHSLRLKGYWNNSGRYRMDASWAEHVNAGPAPSFAYTSSPDDTSNPVVFFLQGVIFDPRSSADVPASITNGILVEVFGQ